MADKIECERCETPISSGDICDNCAEAAYESQQERLMETGGGPSLLEQQRAAYKIKHGLR